jgi:putative DNA primase/helicase
MANGRIVESPSKPMDNARLFMQEKHVDEDDTKLLVRHSGIWKYWAGPCWTELDPEKLRTDIYGFFSDAAYEAADGAKKDFNIDQGKVNKILDALSAVCYLDPEAAAPFWLDDVVPTAEDGTEFDPIDQFVPLKDCILHVETRKQLRHTPSFFTEFALPFDYAPEARCPVWEETLTQWFPDDAEAICALQDMFGMLISGELKHQRIYLFLGPPRAGKGTVVRVLLNLFGKAYVTNPTISHLASAFGLEHMLGKTLAVIPDARTRGNRSPDRLVETLLSISGEDALTVDRKNKTSVDTKLLVRLLMLSNEVPKFLDVSGALASRFLAIPFRQSFLGREDRELDERLAAELPGILNWALAGLDRVRETGKLTVPKSGEAILRQIGDLSSPVSVFVREECVIEPLHWAVRQVLWEEWKRWCGDNGHGPGSKQTFEQQLTSKFPELIEERPNVPELAQRPYAFTGIGLAKVSDPAVTGILPDSDKRQTKIHRAQIRAKIRAERARRAANE